MDSTDRGPSPAIGCVGSGPLAAALARELAEDGCAVRAWLRRRGPAHPSPPCGSTWVHTPREAAQGCPLVFALHDDPTAVRQASLGASGLVSGLARGAVYVEMTPLDPGTARYLAGAAAGAGARFVDAPLLPGSGQEGTDDLPVALVGADRRDLQVVAPFLEAVGCRVLHAGPVGAGGTLFAAVAAVTGPLMAALREARSLLAAGPVDPRCLRLALESRGIAAEAPEDAGDTRPAPPRDEPRRALHRALTLALQIGGAWDRALPVAAVTREVLAGLAAPPAGPLPAALVDAAP